MKSSKYNIIIDADDKGNKMAFNASSGGLAIIDKKVCKLLNNKDLENVNLDNEQSEYVKQLIRGQFFVEKDLDEVENICYKNNMNKFHSKELNLTIMPTNACNFACGYCYQNNTSQKMNLDTQNDLISFIEERLEVNGHLKVVWFGGEPTLEKDIITSITERMLDVCERKNALFLGGMVTNGYNLTESDRDFVNKNKISRIQITLDGSIEEHDKRRILHNGSGTYLRIIENIKWLVKEVSVVVRVNIDVENYSKLSDLLDDLVNRNLNHDIQLSFAKVRANTDACCDIESSCYSTEHFSVKELELERLANTKGFKITKYPSSTTLFCGASNINSFVVEANGDLHKCWNTVGQDKWKVGVISNSKQFKPSILKWINWTPLKFDKCIKCELLPICFGGCPYNYIYNEQSEPDCIEWRYNLESFLKMMYQLKKNK